MTENRFKCPECRQMTGVDIIYGFPSDETFEQAERGDAVLGGCMQEIGARDRQCLSCGHQWDILRRVRANKDWWKLDIPEHIDPAQPGIYEWRIADQSLYIGKSSRLPSRIREYPNNVRKLLEGAPYRKGNATAYREVHHELRMAHDSGIAVTVTILENCERCDLDQREQHWIAIRRREAEDYGPRVLNAT